MFRLRTLGIVLILISTPLSAQFLPQSTDATGPGPFSVAVGDFNGDGIPDLVVVNNGAEEVGVANGVSVLLGNGDGTFPSLVDYGAGYGPHSVITADLNNDGKLDLAVANGQPNTNQVFVLLSNGDGTFSGRGGNWAGDTPQWLAAGDFNGDGNLDLAVASYGSPGAQGGVYIMMGNGDGSFKPSVWYAAGTNPFGDMVADFNHDGILDLAVVDNNYPFGVSILLGNGDGTFQSAMFYPTGRNPRVGYVADLNGDGNLDIAVGDCIDNDVSILFGNGTGYFAPPVSYAAGTNIQLLAAGDFNGDGWVDLVTANSGSSSVSVLPGNGDGTFQAPVDFATGNSPMWVAVADVNRDKAPDLVVANFSDNSVSVLLNEGTDFSISASPASPATVHGGQTATSTISLKLLNSFNNPVTLTYSVQPEQSAPECSLSPNPALLDAQGNATIIMTIHTAPTVVARNQLQSISLGWIPLVAFALIGAGVGSKRRTRAKLATYALGLAVLGGVMFQLACGSGSHAIVQPPPSPQTYTITVTGVSGSAQHSATTAITVQ